MLMKIMVTVHAKRSGVAMKILAWCKLAPIEPLGIPMISAAIPDFQLMPKPIKAAALKKGRTCQI